MEKFFVSEEKKFLRIGYWPDFVPFHIKGVNLLGGQDVSEKLGLIIKRKYCSNLINTLCEHFFVQKQIAKLFSSYVLAW